MNPKPSRSRTARVFRMRQRYQGVLRQENKGLTYAVPKGTIRTLLSSKNKQQWKEYVL